MMCGMTALRRFMAWSLLLAGCSLAPAPILIHDDANDSVWLMSDPEAGAGHSHPAVVSPEQLAAVLQGVRIQKRDALGLGGLFQQTGSAPAFTAREIALLTRHLPQALRKASPRDLATFYLISPDPVLGRVVTSGGLFVRQGRWYLILANAKTSPHAVQYENTYAIDTRDRPLLPIVPLKFVVGFSPAGAWIPNRDMRGKDGYGGYLDDSKLLVIDPARLAERARPAAPQP